MKTQIKLCAAALALVGATSAFAAGEATNVIFFLGDGMGPTTVTASRIYKYGEAGQLTMESLKRTARIKTYSLDGQTTDSAPSMAAYMTGVKMRNEVISMSADTQPRDPVTKKNYTSGADSTCPAGNATYAHICNRNGENAIAAQAVPGGAGYNSALGAGLDVLLGGGTDHFLPTTAGGRRTDGRDLTAELKAQGYTYVNSGSALMALDTAATTRLVGLFSKSLMNYELDRAKPANAIDEPSLADMTEKAIKLLQKNGKGFFLMVEGGRIDHALHNTNAKRALEDTVAFDNAIKRALGLVDLKNTLVVVTADHDHTMTFNGYSHKGNNILGKVSDIKPTTVQGKTVLAKAGDGLPYTALVFGNGSVRKPVRDDLTSVDTAADDYYQEVGVKLGAAGNYPETHGGGDVMLFSSGAGNAGFKGTLDNTKVFGLVKSAMGL